METEPLIPNRRGVTSKLVISYTLPEDAMTLVQYHANESSLGGHSNVRKPEERMNKLGEDALVGQISEYAASVVITGSEDGYTNARDQKLEHPWHGDGGNDIDGVKGLDVKGSMMRYSENPLDYRLLVRPEERRLGWRFVLALVPRQRPYVCHLVGWAYSGDFPDEVYDGRIEAIKGTYVIKATKLRRMDDLLCYAKYGII